MSGHFGPETLAARGYTSDAIAIVTQVVDQTGELALGTDISVMECSLLSRMLTWTPKVGVRSLQRAGVELDTLRAELAQLLRGKADRLSHGASPANVAEEGNWRGLGSVLDRAAREASQLGHGYIGTEHLLLAIVSTNDPDLRSLLRASAISHGSLAAVIVELLTGS